MTARPPVRASAGCTSAQGFALAELMVAIAVGLVLVSGLVMLFANSSHSTNEIEKSMRQIENGRYATELLSENISVAGYYGELTTAGLTLGTPSACATDLGLIGWDNGLGAVPVVRRAPVAVMGLTAAQAAALACLGNHKAGTPALVLRHLDTRFVSPGAVTDGKVYVQTSRCETDPVATQFIVSTASAAFTLKARDCIAFNNVQRYITRAYYIAGCNECGVDTIPTLKRVELNGSDMVASPLAEGIEDVAYEYGFDIDNDGAADTYLADLSGVAGAPANDWQNVVGIRTHLLTRSTETSAGFFDGKTYSLGLSGTRGPFNDSYKRRAYTVTTRLNNAAGLREMP